MYQKNFEQLSLSTISFFMDLDHDTDMVLAKLDQPARHVEINAPVLEEESVDALIEAIDQLALGK